MAIIQAFELFGPPTALPIDPETPGVPRFEQEQRASGVSAAIRVER